MRSCKESPAPQPDDTVLMVVVAVVVIENGVKVVFEVTEEDIVVVMLEVGYEVVLEAKVDMDVELGPELREEIDGIVMLETIGEITAVLDEPLVILPPTRLGS